MKCIELVTLWTYYSQKLYHNSTQEPSKEDTSWIIREQHTNSRVVTFRNIKQINVEEFQQSLNFSHIENIEDLDSVYNKYENELTIVLDQLAPEKN